MEKIRQEYEDKIIQMSIEKEKDFALILDAKMIEHEDHILDIENKLHRDNVMKISIYSWLNWCIGKYQEIIKDLKKENQSLYEESSLKQQKLDEYVHTINMLKEKIKIYDLTIENLQSTRINTSSNIETPQSSTQLQSLKSGTTSNKENLLRNKSFSGSQFRVKSPIDNLQGYWQSKYKKRNSQTRNQNNFQISHSINDSKNLHNR